jgi:hypothetical protein
VWQITPSTVRNTRVPALGCKSRESGEVHYIRTIFSRARTGRKDSIVMARELQLAHGIVEGRLHGMEDAAQRRTVRLARREQRRARRAARRTGR